MVVGKNKMAWLLITEHTKKLLNARMKIIRVKSDMHSFIANTFWLRNYRKILLHKWPQTKMFSISDDTIFWLLGIPYPFTGCDLFCSVLAP